MKKKMQSRSAKGRFQIQEEEPIMLTKSTDPAVRPSTPLAYAQSACDTMIRRYAAADLPPKGHFHYHQGVFLSGVYKTYQLCGNEAYFSYMKDWIDSVFTEDGRIKNDYKHGDLDDIQPGILLFPLLEKTGDACKVTEYSLTPLVTHRAPNPSMSVYKLSDYTEELASQNAIRNAPGCGDFTLQYCYDLVGQILGEGFDANEGILKGTL